MLAFYLSELETKDDKEKFEQIYLSYGKEMFAIANRILRDRESAEDAVQDAFVRIMRNLDKIQDIYSKRTANYIRVIVKNRALQIYRQYRRREVTVEDYHFFLEVPDSFQDVEGQFERKEQADILAGMVLSLPDKYREVLYLYYYNELPYAQIAGILDTTEVNVRQIARRARKILEERLTKEKSEKAKLEKEKILKKQISGNKNEWEGILSTHSRQFL